MATTSSLPMSGSWTHSSPQFTVSWKLTAAGNLTLSIGPTSGTFGYKFQVRARLGPKSAEKYKYVTVNSITSSTNKSETFTGIDTSKVVAIAVKCYAPSCTDGVTSWTQVAKYKPESVEDDYTEVSNATLSVSNVSSNTVTLTPNWTPGSDTSTGIIYIYDSSGNIVLTSSNIAESSRNTGITFTGLASATTYTARLFVYNDYDSAYSSICQFTTSSGSASVTINIVSGKSVLFTCWWEPTGSGTTIASVTIYDYYNTGRACIAYTNVSHNTQIDTDNYSDNYLQFRDCLEHGKTYLIQMDVSISYDNGVTWSAYTSASAIFTTWQLAAYNIATTTNGVSFTTFSNQHYDSKFYWAIVKNQGDENAANFNGWQLCSTGDNVSWNNQLKHNTDYFIVLYNGDQDTKTYTAFTTKKLSVEITIMTVGFDYVSGVPAIYSDGVANISADITNAYVTGNSSTSQVSSYSNLGVRVSGLNDEEGCYFYVTASDGVNTVDSVGYYFKIASGYVHIWNGSKWLTAKPYVWDGTKWRRTIPYVWNGSAWKRLSKS